METLAFKNNITENKNSQDGLNTRMKMTEKRVIKLEDSSIESIQSEQDREKILKNKNNFRIFGTIAKGLIFMSSESQRRGERVQY